MNEKIFTTAWVFEVREATMWMEIFISLDSEHRIAFQTRSCSRTGKNYNTILEVYNLAQASVLGSASLSRISTGSFFGSPARSAGQVLPGSAEATAGAGEQAFFLFLLGIPFGLVVLQLWRTEERDDEDDQKNGCVNQSISNFCATSQERCVGTYLRRRTAPRSLSPQRTKS